MIHSTVRHTLCPHCNNDTHSFRSTSGDQPWCCLACRASKEVGKVRFNDTPFLCLQMNLRDHLTERIPLGVPVVVLDLVGDAFGASVEFSLNNPRTFNAYLESEESVLDARIPIEYDYPGFGKANYRVMVDLGNDNECTGHTFLNRRYLWCLASQVQDSLAAIDTYFGIEPFIGEDLSFLEDDHDDE